MDTRRKARLLLLLLSVSLPVRQLDAAQPVLPPPKPAADESRFGANIARTMNDLVASTPERKAPVRVLLYGQSIITPSIGDLIKKTYTNADVTVVNRHIGGFQAPRLMKTARHDLYPFYPDLLIFHVYNEGTNHGELEDIIAKTRRLTTAEIMIMTHHISHNDKIHEADSQLIRDLAAKYDCELVDIEPEWKAYLADNQLDRKALLQDIVHPNPAGQKLREALMWRHFRYNAAFANPHAAWIKTLPVQPAATGAIKMSFTGNRVDLVPEPTDKPLGTARILVDGAPPSANTNAYAVTRTSTAPGVWWPAILTVGCQGSPQVEDWTLRFTSISTNPAAKRDAVAFEVTGSQTGPDGSYSGGKTFVSKSGRVVIDPNDLMVQDTQAYTKKPWPLETTITWSVVPLFQDVYAPKRIMDSTRLNATTVVQGIANGPHTLEIIPNGDGAVPIKAIRVYQPPLQ